MLRRQSAREKFVGGVGRGTEETAARLFARITCDRNDVKQSNARRADKLNEIC